MLIDPEKLKLSNKIKCTNGSSDEGCQIPFVADGKTEFQNGVAAIKYQQNRAHIRLYLWKVTVNVYPFAKLFDHIELQLKIQTDVSV